MSKIDRFINFLPSELKPASNPILNALLRAWAGADDDILEQLQNTRAQLFVRTASGSYLDRLAANFGVSRPSSLGLSDSDFQSLVPNLSLKQKQVTKSFYDTMDIFWGPTFSRANQTTSISEPYNVSPDHVFELAVDGGKTQRVTVMVGDIQIAGAATALEISRILGRFIGFTAEVIVNQAANYLNLRTDTPGPRGSMNFISGFAPLGVPENIAFKVIDLTQRTVLYQINPGEVIIELPSVVPTLRRSLKGAHHLHTDATLEPIRPPANGQWVGSFLYSTTQQPFLPTSIQTTLASAVLKGSVTNEISVADASKFPLTGGELIFDFGKTNQEYPVKFIAVPNNNTVLIDPGYNFQNTHLVGSSVNVLVPGQTTPYAPRLNGDDYPIYLTSESDARTVIETILKTLVAAGITVTFVVLLPEYRYAIQNPYA